MAEKRTIGQILMGFGRIDEEDVGRALEHQKNNGGYFGEALLALGFVSQDELEWGLASQFDLPYIFPDADSVDPEAAALVSPEWALAHLTLPIAATADTLTVVVDSPIKTDAVDELASRTDRSIELALASSSTIRELIRQVFARAAAVEEGEKPTPVGLTKAFGIALEAAANRFGVSTRKHRTLFWYDDAGTIRRRPLEGLWKQEMEALVTPSLLEAFGRDARGEADVHISREGIVTAGEVRYLADESGAEFLFLPRKAENVLQERFTPPSPGILSEVRLLTRSGAARFVVTTEPAELGHEILPHLPLLLLDASWRSIYIHARARAAADEAFSLELPDDPDEWARELEGLRAFHFDVVTVDLTGHADDWTSTALDVAAVALVLWPRDEDRQAAHDAGIRWELRIDQAEGGQLDWNLEPLRLQGRHAGDLSPET
ncbi:MAG TPA: hypothetical protein VGA70_09390 [Longimicrobiales bacterium]|jgi:hypothetical protein